MKGVYKCVLNLLKKDKPFKVTAPGVWLSIKNAEKLQRKGCKVSYERGKVTVESA